MQRATPTPGTSGTIRTGAYSQSDGLCMVLVMLGQGGIPMEPTRISVGPMPPRQSFSLSVNSRSTTCETGHQCEPSPGVVRRCERLIDLVLRQRLVSYTSSGS